jgi:hypothetical protein
VVARAAVVALPLGVLQAGTAEAGGVTFAPTLRAKQRALGGLGAGHARRVCCASVRASGSARAARLRSMIPPRAWRSRSSRPLRRIPVWWNAAVAARAPVLVGWAGGTGGGAPGGAGTRRAHARAVRTLARY